MKYGIMATRLNGSVVRFALHEIRSETDKSAMTAEIGNNGKTFWTMSRVMRPEWALRFDSMDQALSALKRFQDALDARNRVRLAADSAFANHCATIAMQETAR